MPLPTSEELAASLAEARTKLCEVKDRARINLQEEGGAKRLMDNSGLHFGASIGIYETLFRKGILHIGRLKRISSNLQSNRSLR